MIKEYFTDGLIGLAILLSLFRTDIFDLNIDNLISYPEVQDIIQGQTAVSLPANFHTSGLHSITRHPKFGDREALGVWYRNLLNSPQFHGNTVNIVETFLVSESQRNQNAVVNHHHASNSVVNFTEITTTNNDNVPENSSQALPEESANSFIEPEDTSPATETEIVASTSSASEEPLSVDVTFLIPSPFPGCNLTAEDLKLIDLLWRQDVDLGVGKEVYDQTLREQLERQQELEQIKKQEKLKAQHAAREKEERNRREMASQWLRQNFIRDGETGEWVRLQNQNVSTGLPIKEETQEEETLTLGAALDYISTSVDPTYFASDSKVELVDALTEDFKPFVVQNQPADDMQLLQPTETSIPQLPVYTSDSLEDEWTEVEEYLNISLSDPPQLSQPKPEPDMPHQQQVQSESSPKYMRDEVHSMEQSDLLISGDVPLLQDAVLTPADVDPTPELSSVTVTNMTLPPQPCALNTSLDWEMGNMTFFNNLTTLNECQEDDLDLQTMDELFNSLTEASGMSSVSNTVVNDTSMSTNISENKLPFGSNGTVEDVFDGLEGAIGGANYTMQDNNGQDSSSPEGQRRKFSRLSESSSSDSGYSGGKNGFVSSPSSSSSYTGSPMGAGESSSMSNRTNSNDTDFDPRGTRTLAHRVAHNHTYNTLPGHTPREVKKYAPKDTTKKGPQCRDEKRARDLKIPFSMEQIIESPVEVFNDMITKYGFSEEQLTLIRDIRRRGKNKLAAQNCRKRKVGVIIDLSDEMVELQKVRDRLKAERMEMDRQRHLMMDKFEHLYSHIFESLRDERGMPYDHNLYTLHQTSEGNVFLLPRNATSNGTATLWSNGEGAESRESGSRGTKRKYDN